MHGSFSNSFTWAPLQRELALLGHRSLPVDLPGHGFAADFPVSYQAPQDLAALTGAGNAVPDLIDRIVYISAWCCVDLTVGEYMREPEHASSATVGAAGAMAADPAVIGALRMNWRTADPALVAAMRTAMHDGPDHEFFSYLNTLEPDESLDAGTERAGAVTWGRIRRAYVRLTGDLSMPLELQDRFIREADALTPDNPFDVCSLDSSHVGFLIHPKEAAGILAGLV